MIEAFTLDKVNKSPASFDVQKLTNAFQEHYMRELPVEQKLDMVLPYLVRSKLLDNPVSADLREMVRQIVQAAGDRIKIAGDVLDYSDFFVADDQLPVDDKAFEKRIRKPEKARSLLAEVRKALESANAVDAVSLEQLVQGFVHQQGVELGDIIHALRVAVTGKAVGFGVYEALAILGKPRCLARIDRAVARP
jgi:glutamyl-tRNA synthetase